MWGVYGVILTVIAIGLAVLFWLKPRQPSAAPDLTNDDEQSLEVREVEETNLPTPPPSPQEKANQRAEVAASSPWSAYYHGRVSGGRSKIQVGWYPQTYDINALNPHITFHDYKAHKLIEQYAHPGAVVNPGTDMGLSFDGDMPAKVLVLIKYSMSGDAKVEPTVHKQKVMVERDVDEVGIAGQTP